MFLFNQPVNQTFFITAAEVGHDFDVTTFVYDNFIDFADVTDTSAFKILASDHEALSDDGLCEISQTAKSYWECIKTEVNKDALRFVKETNSCLPYSFAAFLPDGEKIMCKTAEDEKRMRVIF